ncbi:MAG: hypothetical protein WAL47_01455 [Pyrinomonadaceae bacterium]
MVRSSPGVNPSNELGVGNPTLERLRRDVCALVTLELDRSKALSQTIVKRCFSKARRVGLIRSRKVVAPESEFGRV